MLDSELPGPINEVEFSRCVGRVRPHHRHQNIKSARNPGPHKSQRNSRCADWWIFTMKSRQAIASAESLPFARSASSQNEISDRGRQQRESIRATGQGANDSRPSNR